MNRPAARMWPGALRPCGGPVFVCFVLLLASAHTAQAAGVVGTGTSASCTDAALDATLDGGGLVTFNCGPDPVTIDISTGTGTKTIAADTTIDGRNLITISGAGFFVNTDVTFTVQNLTIANCSGAGCGIYNDAGTLTVANSTFRENVATPCGRGGAIFNRLGPLVVVNSTFVDNHALGAPRRAGGPCGGSGGAIFNFLGVLSVTNCTFTGNSVSGVVDFWGHGGGIYNYGSLSITNSTFSDNTVEDDTGGLGGGIYGQPAMLRNTILVNSSSGSDARNIDGGHNIDDGMSYGFSPEKGSLSNTDPHLDPAGLRDNGGPTQTIALLPGSPAIDAGDESACAASPVNDLDQRGYVRPGGGHTQCSIGAYEADATPVEACVGDCDGMGSVTVDEIITLVKIALDTAAPSACQHGVASNAEVNVALIIQAVNAALGGCAG